jgi:tetratricopeptide (TPR) repeat protein
VKLVGRSLFPLALLLASPCGLAAQVPGPASAHGQLVELYARGERAEALAGLAGFKEADLKEVFGALHRLAARAALCGECPERSALDRTPLAAAAMMHADRHWLDRENWRTSEQGPLECAVGPHQQMAERLIVLVAGQKGRGTFVKRFHLAMAKRWHAEMCLAEGLRWVQNGLKWAARDPLLLLARGAMEESTSTLFPRLRQLRPGLTPSQRQEALDTQREGRVQLERARSSLEAAAAADPNLDEARLRLGRIQWRLGEAERARASFEAVIARGGDPGQGYLAHLFLGRVHEDARRHEDAEREYRAALDAFPQAQVAAVALGHVLHVTGRGTPARQVLQDGLNYAGRRTEGDPYWDYLQSSVSAADALFEELREETLR